MHFKKYIHKGHPCIVRIERIFSLDLRALSFFRIAIAIILLADLTMNRGGIAVHFTDAGILPIDLLLNNYPAENYRSLHSLFGSYRWIASLFMINYLVLIGLLLGRKTRRMHLLAWIFFCGMSARNPLIISAGDTVMRMVLFRSMFLPTAAYRSIDSLGKDRPNQNSFFSRTTVGFTVQMVYIYIFSYWLKTAPARTSDFTATYMALSLDLFRTPIGDRVYQYPELMRWMTMYSYYLEGFGWILLLIPFRQYLWKTVGVSAFIAFHLGLILTMKIGHFPWTCMIARCALLPAPIRNFFTTTAKKSGTTTERYRHRTQRVSWFLVACLLYITMRNIRTLDFDKRAAYFPTSINKYGFLLRIDQYRNMFAPYPADDDGWFIVKGTTASGQEVNLLNQTLPVSYEKPKDFSTIYPNEKRRKYFLNIRQKSSAQFRPAYLNYQCTQRNKSHPTQQIAQATMEYVTERTKPNYEVQIQPAVLLEQFRCSGSF